MENTLIKQVVETKFLGIIIDQHLSWKSHFSFISKKILKTVGIIAKARYYLSSKSLLTLYYCLVYPYLTYCNVAWSSTYCCIYLLQKRIVRLISKLAIEQILPHYLANLKFLTYVALILFLLLPLCISFTIIFCLVVFVTSFLVVTRFTIMKLD